MSPRGQQSFDRLGAQPVTQCRRKYGRIRVGNVRCTIGRIVDISAGGLRVLNRAMTPVKADMTIPIQVESDEGWIKATARVVWVRPAGVFRQEMGLQFVEIDEDSRTALIDLARRAGSAGFSLIPESDSRD